MEQSYFIELIKALNTEEKAKIEQFIKFSFVFSGKPSHQAGKLIQLCLSIDWTEPNQLLDKITVFSLLFPGQGFLEGKIDKIMVEAHRIVRDFLLIQHYFRKENEVHQLMDYAEIVRVRGLEARYKIQLHRIRKSLDEAPHEHIFYFHDRYLLEYAVHNEECLHNQVRGDLNIPNAMDALDMHVFTSKIALLNQYLLQNLSAKLEVDEFMQRRLEETYIPERFLEKSVNLKIQHLIFSALKSGEIQVETAQNLFDLLTQSEKKLDEEALRTYYAYLRNICTLILNDNPEELEINVLLFELYKDNLKRGILHYEGRLHPSRYLAISRCAERIGQIDWAHSFIETYKHEIIGDNETHDIYRLNLALYFFNIGDYDRCFSNISVGISNVEYQVTAKRLELKALFELQSDLFQYRLDTFKMFLSRTSSKLLPPGRRQSNMDFFNLLVQIHASAPGDQKRANTLIKRILAKKQASEWHWLLSKAKAL